MDKPGNKLSLHDCYVFSLLDKPGIHEIWTFMLNLTIMININQPPKQKQVLTKVFCIFCPNLVVLPSIDDDVLHGQTINMFKFDF